MTDFDDEVVDALRGLGGPELGDDAAAVRKMNADRKVGIDLNDESNLGLEDLEDKGLAAHMTDAREKLAAARDTTADAKELKAAHQENMRLLSAAITTLTKKINEIQTAVEVTLLESSNASKLAAGERPHGYPEVSTDALLHMGKRLAANGNAYQDIRKELAEALKTLSLFRRGYESTVDGFAKLAN